MQPFSISSANQGPDVRVRINIATPVEFEGALAVVDEHTAVYADGQTVRFRLAGKEPSNWMTFVARALDFTTAHFETGL